MGNIGTKLTSFFHSNNYKIPLFQRDYSWDKDQIEEFWEDAWNTYEEHVQNYFFGPVVLIDENNGDSLKIVDGQQRVTTLTIFMILIRDILKFRGNHGLSTKIEMFFQETSLSQSTSPPKLKLNQNNNHYFEENIFPYDEPNNKISLLKPSLKTNTLLLGAYKQLFEKISEKTIFQDNQTLVEFVDDILKSFEVMVITVDNDRQAYRIFATLNQRGKNLADSDLIKNYLLEMSDQTNVTPHNDRWMNISQELKHSKLDEFLRHSWMANYGFVKKQKLYENITRKIGNNTQVSSFLKLLDEECTVFKELMYPTEAFWGNPRNVIYIKDLFEKFKNDSAQSLFLAAYRKWGNNNDFKALARICMDLHFRCKTVGPKTASDMVTTFVKAAEIIRDGIQRDPQNPQSIEDATLDDVKGVLKKLDINNPDFEMRILNSPYSGTVAKYLLREINAHVHTTRPITTMTSEGTLEHILPQTMNDDWKKTWSNVDHDKYYERIGNLALVHGVSNSEMGNKNFNEKKVLYAQQRDVKITHDLSLEPKWDIDAIENRSQNFAGDVSSIWLSLID
jgi:hypothetical protein